MKDIISLLRRSQFPNLNLPKCGSECFSFYHSDGFISKYAANLLSIFVLGVFEDTN